MNDGTAPSPLRKPRQLVTVLAGFLLVASAAAASVLVSYNTSSTTSFSLKAPPITWAAGPDASGNNYVASWSLSGNATYYTVTLKPVPEVNVTWENITTLHNTDTAAYHVWVNGTSVSSNTKILAFRLEFFSYSSPSTLAGALDLRQASPSLDLGTVAAGGAYFVKAYVKLDTGAGSQDLPSSVTVSLGVAA